MIIIFFKCSCNGVPKKWLRWKNSDRNSFQLQNLLFLFLCADQIRLHWDEVIGYSEKKGNHQIQLCTNATFDLISFAFCMEIYLSVILLGFEVCQQMKIWFFFQFFSDSKTAVKLVFRRFDIVIMFVRLFLLFMQAKPHQRMLFCAFSSKLKYLFQCTHMEIVFWWLFHECWNGFWAVFFHT